MNASGKDISLNEGRPMSRQLPNSGAEDSFIVSPDDLILITGGAGFIGSRVVEALLDRGFRNLRCFARSSSVMTRIESIIERRPPGSRIEVIKGNLQSRQDCETASKDVALILHLAAGTGEKSFPDAFINSVVTTRNLLDATRQNGSLRRFVLVSSFSVYTNRHKRRWRLLDESCPIEEHPEVRGDAYCFAKVKQEQLLAEYGKNFGIPYVIVRPGSVYGEGKGEIAGRVGIGTFGFFLHMGGSNPIPFTYVDNCAEAIVLAGLVKGVDGEIFNVVDDDLPSSRKFLRMYKKNVRRFKSVYIPHQASYALSYLWEKYSEWSEGQLPAAFNRGRWHAFWKKTHYTNKKLKTRLGWTPKVSTKDGMRLFFESSKRNGHDA
ncbi:MAG: NAD(P)-dependent oxidoreductase [Candidatus Acidiferrales bacterium]